MKVKGIQSAKQLLPFKNEYGLVYQYKEINDDENENSDNLSDHLLDDADLTNDPDHQLNSNVIEEKISVVESLSENIQQIHAFKESIADLSEGILENPEENNNNLKKLRLLYESDLAKKYSYLQDYVIVSLCEVYKDILPSYQIRVASAEEKGQQAKKETKKLRAYEESLLLNYKKYLHILQTQLSRKKKNNNKKKARTSNNRMLLIQCICDLLSAHPYFNFAETLANILIPHLNDHNENISSLIKSTLEQVFAEDLKGEVSYLVVKAIYRFIISRKFKVRPNIISVFSALNIKVVKFHDRSKPKLTYKERKEQLSRKERKTTKVNSQLTNDLEHLEAQENQVTKIRLHTKIVEMIFHVFIRVLKRRPDSKLLSAVLEGLRQFALLVNMDFIPDILNSFSTLLTTEKLSPLDSMRVIFTSLSILSREGSSLSIDPRTVYLYAYKNLHRICDAKETESNIPLLIDVFRALLVEHRKDIPQQRPLNFLKRMIDIAVTVKSSLVGAVLLSLAAQLFALYPKAAPYLLDPEDNATAMASPVPILDNPDLAFPSASSRPQLQKLSTHSDASIRSAASQLLRHKFTAIPDAYSVYRSLTSDSQLDQPPNQTDSESANQKASFSQPTRKRKTHQTQSKFKGRGGKKRRRDV